ncbi:MAG: hypothetical protein ACXIUV_14435 [Alkalilacustris sp.]
MAGGGGLFGWRRAVGQLGLMLAAGLCLAVSGGFLLAALWQEIAGRWDPVVASLGVAGVSAAAALVLLLIAGLRGRRPRRRGAGDTDAALRALFAEAGLKVPEPGERPPLVEAFLFGLVTALKLGRGRRG